MGNNKVFCTIGIFGHYGHENLGDEAIIEALIQNVQRKWPPARLIGLSVNPQDTHARYGIPAYPIRRDLGRPIRIDEQHRTVEQRGKRPSSDLRSNSPKPKFRERLKQISVLRAMVRGMRFVATLPSEMYAELQFLIRCHRLLKDVDLLLIAGSNQFLDNFGGPWGYPYTVLKWSIVAKLAGTRVMFVSVGAGPIDALTSRVMVRIALLCGDYASFRDAASKRLIEWAGLRRGLVYPDLAHSLTYEKKPRHFNGSDKHQNRPVVGINPMPMYDPRYWCLSDKAGYQLYIDKLAQFASILLRDRFPVFFFGTQSADELAIDDVISRLNDDVTEQIDKHALIRRSRTVSEIMDVIASADIIVATRFHGAVLALRAERPVLGICYYRKARDILTEMGQERYALDLDDLDVDEMLRRFHALVENRAVEMQKIDRRNRQYLAMLDEQYEMMLRLVQDRVPRCVSE